MPFSGVAASVGLTGTGAKAAGAGARADGGGEGATTVMAALLGDGASAAGRCLCGSA